MPSASPSLAATRARTLGRDPIDTVSSWSPFPIMIAAALAVVPVFLFRAQPSQAVAVGAGMSTLMLLPILGRLKIFANWKLPSAFMALMLVMYAVMTLFDEDYVDGAKTFVQVALAFVCFFSGVTAGRHAEERRELNYAIIIVAGGLSAGLYAMLLLKHASLNDDLPKNAVGGLILYLSVLAVTAYVSLTRNAKSLRWLAFLMLVDGVLSGQRLILGLAPLVLIAIEATRILRSHRLERIMVYGAGVISVLSVYMYLIYKTLSQFDAWNRMVDSLTGRQITSGRQLIWGPVLDRIQLHPYVGNGLSAYASDVTGLDFSTHNAFLLVLLQVGLVGLAPLVGLLLSLCWVATRGSISAWKSLFAIILTIVIIHNSYEAALIQNNFSIASLLWLSLGFIGGRIAPPAEALVLRRAIRRAVPIGARAAAYRA